MFVFSFNVRNLMAQLLYFTVWEKNILRYFILKPLRFLCFWWSISQFYIVSYFTWKCKSLNIYTINKLRHIPSIVNSFFSSINLFVSTTHFFLWIYILLWKLHVEFAECCGWPISCDLFSSHFTLLNPITFLFPIQYF